VLELLTGTWVWAGHRFFHDRLLTF